MANPTPITITDSNGHSLAIIGATSGPQLAAPIPAVLCDVNGNSLNLAAGSGTGTVNTGTIHQIAIYAATGTAVSGDSLLTESGTVLAYIGTGGVTAAKLGITSGNIFSGQIAQILGSGDIEVPVLNIRLDSNAGVAAGVACLIEDFTNFANSNPLLQVQAHNAGDSSTLVNLVNAGTGKYIAADAVFAVAKSGAVTLSGSTPTVTTGQLGLGTTTATTASAGANGDVPAQVVGYLEVNLAGTMFKIPYYAS